MAANVYAETARGILSLDESGKQRLREVNNDPSGVLEWANNVTKILEKEFSKLRKLSRAKKRNGLESLRQKLPDLVDSLTDEVTKDQTIVVDETMKLERESIFSSTITQTVKRSTRIAAKTTSIIKTRRQTENETDNSVASQKRLIEDEVDLFTSTSKRAKIKNDPEKESETFKKPKPLRGRRKNAEEKSVIDINDRTVDESSFFESNILHSSPKVDAPPTNKIHVSPPPSTLAIEVKTPSSSVKDRVAAFERLRSEMESKSTPKKDPVKNLEANLGKLKDINLGRNSSGKKIENKEKDKQMEVTSEDSQDDEVIEDSENESNQKTDNVNEVLSKKSIRRSKRIEDSDEKESPVKNNVEGNLDLTRTLKGPSQNEIAKLEVPNELNSTQVIPTASKRTKPVVKSKIFDATGNNMLIVNEAKVVKPIDDAKLDSTFVVPAYEAKSTRRSSRLKSDKESDVVKSDSELAKSKKRSSTELSDSESESKPKKKSSKEAKPKMSKVRSNNEFEKVEKVEAVTEIISDVEKPEGRTKRTRPVRQAAVKEDGDMEIPPVRASKRTKPVAKLKEEEMQVIEEEVRSTRTKTIKNKDENKVPVINVINSTVTNVTSPRRRSDEENQSPKPKKRTKINKKKEAIVEEEDDVIPDQGRITRTKSKAAKQILEENANRKSRYSSLVKKSLEKAKIISLQKEQLEKLKPVVCITPDKGMNNHLMTLQKMRLLSTSKNQVLMNSTNKLKTPNVYTPMTGNPFKVPPISSTKGKYENSSSGKSKYLYHSTQSVGKDNSSRKPTTSSSSVESMVRSATKQSRDEDIAEKQMKLKSKKEREEEARLKKEQAIKLRQEELKKRNELKLKTASKQRERLEQEKHKNIVQSEKEKEEKRKIILQERKMKQEEEARMKKLLSKQKLAETEERRRMEEEARLAKLKEQEEEQNRIQLEKQKEKERNEKRAQERLAEKKARELFEQKQKQEQLAEKQAKEKAAKKAAQLASASKPAKFVFGQPKREWNIYKPRNENDYGLEDEHSELESGDEEPDKPDKPYPVWAKFIMDKKGKVLTAVQLKMMTAFMTCYQKTPDVVRMFKMTPSKRIKRTSSAIWNTPSS